MIVAAVGAAWMLFAATAMAQTSATSTVDGDSTANIDLTTSDDPEIDIDSYYDEVESTLRSLHTRIESRAEVDPNAHVERGYTEGVFLGSSTAALQRIHASAEPIGAGFAAQKDAWEQSYFDDWAGFLELQQPQIMSGVSVTNAIVGNYRISVGSGLLLGSGLTNVTLRNSPAHLLSHESVGHALSPHSQSTFFGAAVRVRGAHLSFTPFVSSQKLDARVDSIGVRSIAQFYHRTADEVALRNTLSVQALGGHLAWADSATELAFGTTAMRTRFGTPLMTNSSKLVRGSQLLNAGIDASWHSTTLEIAGEGAVADREAGRGYAGLVSVTAIPIDRVRLLLMYHRQDTDYYAPYAAIADAAPGDATNSEGYWLGLESRLTERLKCAAGLDLNGRIANSSTILPSPKSDAFVDLRYAFPEQSEVAMRIRSREFTTKEASGEAIPVLEAAHQSNLRVIGRYLYSASLSLQVRGEYTVVDRAGLASRADGVYGQASAVWVTAGQHLEASIGRFSTSSYDARVYSYISTLRGTGTILLFYGSGYYASVGERQLLLPWLSLEGFAGAYFYDHTRTFGSGLTERRGANDIDIAIQISATP